MGSDQVNKSPDRRSAGARAVRLTSYMIRMIVLINICLQSGLRPRCCPRLSEGLREQVGKVGGLEELLQPRVGLDKNFGPQQKYTSNIDTLTFLTTCSRLPA